MNFQFVAIAPEQFRPGKLGGTGDCRLNGGRDCSSAIFRNSRNVNCST
jgi:hypothetical protein